jgi:hypothetical protein
MTEERPQLLRELIDLGVPRRDVQEAERLMEWVDEGYDCD